MKKTFVLFILTLFFAAFFVKNAHAIDWTGIACTDVSQCPNATQYICATGPNPAGGGSLRQCADISAGGFSNPAAQTATEKYIRGVGGKNGVVAAVSDGIGDMFTGAPGQPGAAAYVLRYSMSLYQNKPASTGEYLADLKKNLGVPVKTAYAQGFGFESLSPILGLWRLARNVALVGFVVIFVIIGMMIMLRSKIDPRTVVTIQQAIPKIIIAMILVIFSYAICGLLIDTVTVGTRLGARLLQTNGFIGVGGNEGEKILNLTNANIFKLWDQLYNINELLDSFTSLGEEDFTFIAGVLGFDALLDGGITRVVLFIAMFIALLRTFFLLLTSYLTVTLKIILSPFQFLMLAIPGSTTTFGGWLKGMMSHLLVFPLVFFMLSFAAIFVAKNNTENVVWFGNTTYSHWYSGEARPNLWSVGQDPFKYDTQYWAPPALGNWGGAVGPLLSLGILLTIPKAGALVKEAMQQKGSSAAEGAATEGIQKAAGRIPILGSLTRV